MQYLGALGLEPCRLASRENHHREFRFAHGHLLANSGTLTLSTVKKSLEGQKDLTQGRKVAKVAKQTQTFSQVGSCALASWREAVHFFSASRAFGSWEAIVRLQEARLSRSLTSRLESWRATWSSSSKSARTGSTLRARIACRSFCT